MGRPYFRLTTDPEDPEPGTESMRKYPMVVAAALAALALAGCDDEGGTPLPIETARLRLLNAASAAPAVDLAVDGQVVASDVAYSDESGPLDVAAGARELEVRDASTDVLLATLTTNLAAGEEYELLAGSTVLNIVTPATVDTGAPRPDRAHVRIVVVAPPFTDSASAPPSVLLDVYITPPGADLSGASTTLSLDARYPSYSTLLYLDPGSWMVRFTEAGTTDVVAATGALSIAAGQIRAVMIEKPSGEDWSVAVVAE
jgi:hypothetical protein